MNIDEMREIVALIDYPDYEFIIGESNGEHYLQARYYEPDIITKEPTLQPTRKWKISTHAVKSEIVQTALKCVLTSAEHRVREHFLYRGERILDHTLTLTHFMKLQKSGDSTTAVRNNILTFPCHKVYKSVRF